MELLRQWAMRVCISCVLAGALGQLLPAKGSARVIKTVVALYILVSVLAPVQRADWSALRRQLQQLTQLSAPAVMPDTDALIGQTASEALSSYLTLQLSQQGIEATVSVKAADPDAPEGGLQVTAMLRDTAQAGEAETILRREMNGAGSILCRGMEGSP